MLITDVTGRYTRGCADEVTLARGRSEGDRWWWPFALRECTFSAAAASARDKKSAAFSTAGEVISLEPTTSGNTVAEAIAVDELETVVLVDHDNMSNTQEDEEAEDAAALAEESELRELAAATAPLPKTLAAYKKHPTYALEAQLGK